MNSRTLQRLSAAGVVVLAGHCRAGRAAHAGAAACGAVALSGGEFELSADGAGRARTDGAAVVIAIFGGVASCL